MSDTPETDKEEFPCMTWPKQDHPMVVRSSLARKLERERNTLRKALRLAGKLCEEVHHPKDMQHEYGTDCPVEAFIQNALDP